MDRIGYPHVRVGYDTGFGSDTPKSISNPYPFKKIGFYPYPLSGQRIFLLFDQIGSGRKSMDTDTFSISTRHPLSHANLQGDLLRPHPTSNIVSGTPTPICIKLEASIGRWSPPNTNCGDSHMASKSYILHRLDVLAIAMH